MEAEAPSLMNFLVLLGERGWNVSLSPCGTDGRRSAPSHSSPIASCLFISGPSLGFLDFCEAALPPPIPCCSNAQRVRPEGAFHL